QRGELEIFGDQASLRGEQRDVMLHGGRHWGEARALDIDVAENCASSLKRKKEAGRRPMPRRVLPAGSRNPHLQLAVLDTELVLQFRRDKRTTAPRLPP